MTIKDETPITMAEVVEIAGSSEKGEAVKTFIKKFNTMSFKKASEMKEELESLGLIKLKAGHIIKIVDFIPTSVSELNKIVSDISLDQEEINKILDVTKKY